MLMVVKGPDLAKALFQVENGAEMGELCTMFSSNWRIMVETHGKVTIQRIYVVNTSDSETNKSAPLQSEISHRSEGGRLLLTNVLVKRSFWMINKNVVPPKITRGRFQMKPVFPCLSPELRSRNNLDRWIHEEGFWMFWGDKTKSSAREWRITSIWKTDCSDDMEEIDWPRSTANKDPGHCI